MGAFQMGYAISGNNQTANLMAVKFKWTEDQTRFYNSFINFAAQLGLAVGCTLGGITIQIGRRKTILIFNFISAVSVALSLILSIPTILIGKLVFGVCAGILNTACPKFLDETVPYSLIGLYGTSTNIFLCLGLGAAMFIGAGLPDETDIKGMEEDEFWRVVYGTPLISCLIL
jgi:predicted MFS family arabinose efflux permease